MIVNHQDTNEVTLSNTGATGEFKIRNSAKAFSILSSGLYSNKIKAIIRELSCNALDSHVGAGKADVPFEVHLPTMLEPWFSVRDFGMGLDGNQVVNIYTTYFESTKTNSNDFIGALGLGSKSPFSYTENFTVTAIKNGTQRIYSAYINEQGVPSIVEMSEELTDQGNGVEVKFSVTDQYDYRTFQNEAQEVFMWFENKPKITGGKIELRSPDYKEKNIVPGVHVRNGDYYSRHSIAIMGNIAYPLSDLTERAKHFGALEHLLDCNLVLSFDIGELDFAASREHLSYIPMTIDSIRKKLELLNANLATHMSAKVDAIEGDWEKALFLYEQSNSQLYRSAVMKYVTDTNFALYDPKDHYGRKRFNIHLADLVKRKLSINAFVCRNGKITRKHSGSVYVNGKSEIVWQIPVEKNVVIVLNDLKTGCQSRAEYHYSNRNNGKEVNVFCLSHDNPDLAVRQKEYDKFIAELHNPPVVLKASELEMRPRATPLPSTGIANIRLKSEREEGDSESYTWEPCRDVVFNDTKTYYYVRLENFTTVDENNKPFDFFKIKALMDVCGIKAISDIEIYGVRKSRIKEIESLDNWVYYEDILKKETAKISDKHIASLVASEMLDTPSNRVYTKKSVADRVGASSAYAKYVTFAASIPRANGNVNHLVQLCSKFDNNLRVGDAKKKIQDEKDKLYEKYPLLRHFKESSLQCPSDYEVADYIKLVDKQ